MLFDYEHEAFARVDADTWFVDLTSVVQGGDVRLVLDCPIELKEHATSYVVRQRGLCRKRVPLRFAAASEYGDRRALLIEYKRQRGDLFLTADTASRNEPIAPPVPGRG